MGIQRVPAVPFAQIANSALRDRRLSFKARGVLALVLSNVGEWEATAAWIENQSDRDGAAAIKSALKELTTLGYRRVGFERNPVNGQVRTITEWGHEPVPRPAENPPTGEPDDRGTDPSIEDHPLEHHLEEHDHTNTVVADPSSTALVIHGEPVIGTFDEFWQVYPRHEAKAAARKAWAKAITQAAPEAIIAGAARYHRDPNRDPAFTAHPATWLNAGRWDDEPLPARTSGKKSATQMYMEASHDLAPGQQALAAAAFGVDR